jgi:DNA-binding transcriptional ArsR family regulator
MSEGTLAMRLGVRRAELERAVLTCVFSVADPAGHRDTAYAEGLRGAVSAGVSYGLRAMEESEPDVPEPLLAQARRAARHGVGLDTVLRRYLAGCTLLWRFVLEDTGSPPLAGHEAEAALRIGGAFDQVLAAVAAEYRREQRDRFPTADRRLAQRVEKLLGGDSLEPADFGYELASWHLGLIGRGPGAERAVSVLASRLDRHLLLVRPGQEVVWAWLGGRTRIESDEIRLGEEEIPGEVSIAVGEPGRGIAGWRRSHRQATAALEVARRRGSRLVFYADVVLLAAALDNGVLSESLVDLYLSPLAEVSDGGSGLCRTLRAYFNASRSVSSAAVALGVSRQTVSNHLRRIEELVGRPVERCGAELETALYLRDLGEVGAADGQLRNPAF